MSDFQRWGDGPPEVLKLVGHSPQKVVDVFTAWVESSSPEVQSQISSRTLIVESPDAWRKLRYSDTHINEIETPIP
jgi:hypothetical protein